VESIGRAGSNLAGMGDETTIADLIANCRNRPPVPARLGRHDVAVEHSFVGTFVYQVRGDRILVVQANRGYRDDVAVALLDAVDGFAEGDHGAAVRLAPIDVAGFPLDRAALLGPGCSDFFKKSPLAPRGMQVIPVHRSEAADGEDYESFWPVLGWDEGLRHQQWTRDPSPRADVLRVDGVPDGRTGITQAKWVLGQVLPGLPDGAELTVADVRGYQLRLHRDWDRLRGTLRFPAEARAAVAVDIPKNAGWAVFGPLFSGGAYDPAAFEPAALDALPPPAPMLMLKVNDAERRRYDDAEQPADLETCLRWLDALAATDGNFLVFAGRSGGVVQLRWEGPGEPRLWLEAPELAERRSRGRHVTRDEAATMVEALAREDRVAVDDLGDLDTVNWDDDK
jgi:hypothetical protein